MNKYLTILIFFIISSFFSISLLDLKANQYIHIVLIFYFTAVIIANNAKKPLSNAYNKKIVLFFIFVPLFSVYACYVLHGQPIITSLIVYRRHLAWLFYFFLWYKKVSSKLVYKLIIVFGIIYTSIELFQQFTYPHYLFFTRDDNTYIGGLEVRMGLYRYAISGIELCVMALFVVLSNIKQRIYSREYYLLVLYLFLGVYAYLSRQIIIATFMSICTLIIYSKNNKLKQKVVYTVGLIVFILALYFKSTQLFGELANFSDSFEIGRLNSYLYYFYASIQSSLSFLLGNGVYHNTSLYGIEMISLHQNGLILSDIGIIGILHSYGIFFVIGFYWMVLRLLVNKNLSLFLKCNLLVWAIVSPIYFVFWEFPSTLFFAMFLYLCDVNIVENKKIITTKEKSAM